eukprot:TRINITY_DN12279_c1_g1_i11.p5 TRINITY_DN12279_c1_g1~~TRINITY_DN12279_c1_g1_i11.p5  ORF type:complete len:139 (+),score=10.78 TRINITY_DN12279_c1_g1_i11:1423-1839(+)
MSDDGKASRATLSHRTIGGFAAVDMLKIVTQMLQENGYDECAEHLQSTIGFSCESQNGGQFRAAVREARWSTAVQLADVIQFVGAKGSQKAGNVSICLWKLYMIMVACRSPICWKSNRCCNTCWTAIKLPPSSLFAVD